MPPPLAERLKDLCGANLGLLEVFGQTEASGFISQTELDDGDEEKAATLGRPLPGVEVRVVDPETATLVATGQVGELEVADAW